MLHVRRTHPCVRRALAHAAVVAVALVALSGDASAQKLTNDPRTDFRRFDITEGGYLSGTELDACGCRRYDTDHDAEVTLAEYEAGRARETKTKAAPAPKRPVTPAAASPAAEFARFDITEDGWLSGTELKACGCIAFDRDRDGEVTRAEYLAGAAKAKPKKKSFLDKLQDFSDSLAASNRRNAAKDEPTRPAKPAPVQPTTPATHAPTPTPAPRPVAPAPTPAPAPAPVTAAGPPAGLWSCYNYQPHLGYGTYWGQVRLDAGGTYEHLGVSRGQYGRANGTIAFRSGDMAPIYDVKYPTGSGSSQFDLIGKGELEGIFVRCALSK